MVRIPDLKGYFRERKQPLSLFLTAGLAVIIFGILSTGSLLSTNPWAGLRESAAKPLANSEKLSYWSSQIEKIGAEKAYLEFKKEVSALPLPLQHGEVHFIGPLLYEKLGPQGFVACDTDFNYGCYHGFFAAALSDKGVALLTDLNKACEEKYNPRPSPCQHGIGHGLMSYLGRAKLVEALEYCKLTNQKDPLHGCTSGLFMEYNTSTHFSPDGVNDIRPLNSLNPYEPCNTTVPGEFRRSCYFEIGLWWREVYNRDFTKIGQLCQNIADSEERKACFSGLALVIAPTTSYNAYETVKLCQKMPSLEGELICRAGSYLVFDGLDAIKHLAPKICEDLASPERELCQKK